MRLRSLAPLCEAQFLGGVVTAATGPLMLPIMKDLGMSVANAGSISFGLFLGRGIGGLALLFLLARVPVKRNLVAAYLLQAAALAAAGLLARGIWSFFAPYAIAGFASMMPMTLSGMWVAACVRERTARALSFVVAFFALGSVIAPLAVGFLLGSGVSWRWVLAGEGCLSLAFAASTALSPVADIAGRKNLSRAQVREIVAAHPGLFAAILAAGFLYSGMESIFGVWLPKFQASIFGVGAASAGYAATLFWLGLLVGRFAFVPVSRRVVPFRLILGLAGASLVLSFVIAFAPGHTFSALVCFLAGLSASALWPLLSGYCSRFPDWHAGAVYSAMSLTSAFGSAALPGSAGLLAGALGLRAAIALAALPACGIGLLAVYLRGCSPTAAATSVAVPVRGR